MKEGLPHFVETTSYRYEPVYGHEFELSIYPPQIIKTPKRMKLITDRDFLTPDDLEYIEFIKRYNDSQNEDFLIGEFIIDCKRTYDEEHFR